MCFRALITMSAWIQFVIFRMIFLFLPTMALHASILILAPIFVTRYELSWSPVRTLFFWILIQLRLSSEILPIVSIHTDISQMFAFIVGTPNWFEMKHIEVDVFLKLVYQFNWYFSLRMGKWTILTILTFIRTINIGGAKLGLVFVRVIEFFNSVMSFLALLSFMAFFAFSGKMAHFGLVYT